MKAIDWVVGGVTATALIVAAFVTFGGPKVAPPTHPLPAVAPDPDCPDGRCPARRPWGPRGSAGSAVSFVNGREYDGETLACDFPLSMWMPNIGSRVDGAGMCVATSVEMVAIYLGMDFMRGFRDWCSREPGGCYPSKLEDQLTRYCKMKGVPVPPYIDFTGSDPAGLLEQLDAAGLPYAHQYDECPRYASVRNPKGKIAHMVFGVKFGGKYAVVVDNNEIGGVDGKSGKIFEWMPKSELIRRMEATGSDWIFAFIVPPPPPTPKVGG